MNTERVQVQGRGFTEGTIGVSKTRGKVSSNSFTVYNARLSLVPTTYTYTNTNTYVCLYLQCVVA